MDGSFCFTHASLAAVKFPGRFRRCSSDFLIPIFPAAFSPSFTALLSHQIMAGLSGFCAASTHTRPCIWYDMPMALISLTFEPADFFMRFVADFRFSHHISGSCSAHPAFLAIISISFDGDEADAAVFPVSASMRAALIDELPISYPNRYIRPPGIWI